MKLNIEKLIQEVWQVEKESMEGSVACSAEVARLMLERRKQKGGIF